MSSIVFGAHAVFVIYSLWTAGLMSSCVVNKRICHEYENFIECDIGGQDCWVCFYIVVHFKGSGREIHQ